jgi:hypothetical protein
MAKYRQYVSTLSIDQIASIETAFQLNKNGAHLCVLRKQREKKKKKKVQGTKRKKKNECASLQGLGDATSRDIRALFDAQIGRCW